MKTAVLHFALNPITGVWSVMKILAQAQTRSGNYASVGIGILMDQKWPQLCREEFAALSLPVYSSQTVNWFGTAKFLWQCFRKPPLDQWVQDFAAKSGADTVVLHCHNAWLSGVFQPVTAPGKAKLVFVATFHGVNGHFRHQPVRQGIHRWMASRLTKHGAVLTSVDRANLARAEKLLAMNPGEFTVIPNGIEDSELRGCPWLSGQPAFTLGHIGSISAAKGWQMLVGAARSLREKGHNINVILAGRGEDAELATKLAAESGGWLRYVGFVPNPQEVVLKNVDALVLMSEQEGLPMAIIEALSMGVPVLATPVGGVPEAVINGKNGFLVERTAEALAEAIQPLLNDPDKLREMSVNARRSFEDHFEISRVVSMYDNIYQLKA
jgi:glycosyltransferase involved in cell wall biosynthesis